MDGIVIKHNKRTLIPMLIVFIIALVGVGYNAFFNYDSTINKIISLGFCIGLLYAIYSLSRKLIENQAVLIIDMYGIEIREKKKAISINWDEIKEWKIVEDDSNSYLIISITHDRTKTDISWLDKKPEEIKEIIEFHLHQLS